jgi:hypothetical protein
VLYVAAARAAAQGTNAQHTPDAADVD